jgi:hypothetical protein
MARGGEVSKTGLIQAEEGEYVIPSPVVSAMKAGKGFAEGGTVTPERLTEVVVKGAKFGAVSPRTAPPSYQLGGPVTSTLRVPAFQAGGPVSQVMQTLTMGALGAPMMSATTPTPLIAAPGGDGGVVGTPLPDTSSMALDNENQIYDLATSKANLEMSVISARQQQMQTEMQYIMMLQNLATSLQGASGKGVISLEGAFQKIYELRGRQGSAGFTRQGI